MCRQDELEAGAALGGRLVEDLSSARLRVGLRDRQAEPRALRLLTAREALEEPRDELRGDSLAGIGDREAEMGVVLLRADLDRGRP